ncbi:MAG: ATP-dependent DNA helicase RecG [SAR202 cluster bacterium]|nr:ATP-dependent DNA helicase RecG [SAR202 cluster bacterium]
MTTFLLETLVKILSLETEQEYQDRSVIGGMNTFLNTAFHPSHIPEQLITDSELASLMKFDYSTASISKRRLWVSTVSNKIQRISKPDSLNISPPKRTSRTSPKKKMNNNSFSLFNKVTDLKGVDTKTQERLGRLGISNIWDLLFNPPRTLLDYSNLLPISEVRPGEACTILGEVWTAKTLRLGAKGRLQVGEVIIGDSTGNIRCLWFGNRFISKTLKTGSKVYISGQPEIYRGSLVFQSPEYELADSSTAGIHTGRLLPVYRLTSGLTAKKLRTLSWNTLKTYQGHIPLGHVGPTFYKDHDLMPLDKAVKHLHFPEDETSHAEARRTLGLEELIHLQLALSIKKTAEETPTGVTTIQVPHHFLREFSSSLPFQLTNSQLDCINNILNDMTRSHKPMTRLLQGDVGSGKTVVVAAAILANIGSGFQSALMAPTEILAEQHFLSFQSFINPEPARYQSLQPIQTIESPVIDREITLALLTGSTTPSQKLKIYEGARDGTIDLLIGTQSLINEELKMNNLNLAVTDEQHRFGVLQRSELKDPATIPPHSLTMSATPIPRTLSLSIYGDLDISTIDELPKGRRPVKTRSIQSDKIPVAYGFMKKQILEGHQAFVVCPAIDENPELGSLSVTEVFKNLVAEFPDLSIELLHGRMSTKKKDSIMEHFRDGSINILVSTSVIEVGVDVPNANIMLIHGADRFGLSQLHQFRGRVGRGTSQSYCVLISMDPSETALERLNALEQTTDGFALAEKDLQLRGPGDYFGVRQSGMPSFKIANIFDYSLMELAKDTASMILASDPNLKASHHLHLKFNVEALISRIVAETS